MPERLPTQSKPLSEIRLNEPSTGVPKKKAVVVTSKCELRTPPINAPETEPTTAKVAPYDQSNPTRGPTPVKFDFPLATPVDPTLIRVSKKTLSFRSVVVTTLN